MGVGPGACCVKLGACGSARARVAFNELVRGVCNEVLSFHYIRLVGAGSLFVICLCLFVVVRCRRQMLVG